MQSGEPGGNTATVMASACKGDTCLCSHAISDLGRCAYALRHALAAQTDGHRMTLFDKYGGVTTFSIIDVVHGLRKDIVTRN